MGEDPDIEVSTLLIYSLGAFLCLYVFDTITASRIIRLHSGCVCQCKESSKSLTGLKINGSPSSKDVNIGNQV